MDLFLLAKYVEKEFVSFDRDVTSYYGASKVATDEDIIKISQIYNDIRCVMAAAFQTLNICEKHGHWEETEFCDTLIHKCTSWLSRMRELGIIPAGIRNGSVVLIVTCESLEALDFIWNQCISGKMKEQLEQIFLTHFESKYPRYEISLEVRICSHQYLYNYDKLVEEKGMSNI